MALHCLTLERVLLHNFRLRIRAVLPFSVSFSTRTTPVPSCVHLPPQVYSRTRHCPTPVNAPLRSIACCAYLRRHVPIRRHSLSRDQRPRPGWSPPGEDLKRNRVRSRFRRRGEVGAMGAAETGAESDKQQPSLTVPAQTRLRTSHLPRAVNT